jgi:enoyl-CoA hydratase
MGLATRVVPSGTARDAAVTLAHQLAALPQGCLRSDRASLYEQWDFPLAEALTVEMGHGMDVLRSGEARAGAARFARGAGRHGSFEG